MRLAGEFFVYPFVLTAFALLIFFGIEVKIRCLLNSHKLRQRHPKKADHDHTTYLFKSARDLIANSHYSEFVWANEIFYDETLCCDVADKDYDREMITIDNKCVALINGHCSIYDKRPQVCRLFEVDSKCCQELRSDRITIHNNNPCVFSCKIKL